MTPLRKVLIANRGEIAVRIAHACRELGITTVAVYSEVDAHALHTRLADEASLIGPPPPTESYLCIERILAVAQQTQCDAIHPGYGFLAENATFAEAVADAGLIFVGPDAAAIRAMGSKTAARAVMQAAGVPVVPGFQESDEDDALLQAAPQIGFPLLIKAVAGGGGKGMRTVRALADFPDALQSARNEAQRAFGDSRVYLEKLLEAPRHVEFQVFGDQQGNLVHLFERECSIQRRHQKIIEETPSPLLDDDLRQRMGAAAIQAAQAVNYTNAGTVEFLVDGDCQFYFLEMNTRLQVEHPITELVTGLDLVKWQLRIAAGEPLPLSQAAISQRGHALECRIYAEDPWHDFLPAVGKIHYLSPPTAPGIRVDSGVCSGDEVTHYYDPMIAKLSVLAETRQEAIERMERALHDFVILGNVTTNIPFLRAVLTHPDFVQGVATTQFVEGAMGEWQATPPSPDDLVFLAAALAESSANNSGLPANFASMGDPTQDIYNPWRQTTGFRVSVKYNK